MFSHLRRRLWVCVLLILGVPSGALAQTPPDPTERFTALRARLQQLTSVRRVASVSIGVAKGGEILWEEGFGLAALEQSVAAGPHTLYPLASVTKPLTATGVMVLFERGLIDLDAPVNRYLGPEGRVLGLAGPDSLATVRRVLAHTAGLPRYWEFFYDGEGHGPLSADAAIRRYATVVLPPGEHYNYSNIGYAVLGRIIERVSGKEFGQFMREEVFLPLGMVRTTFSPAIDFPDEIAIPYSPDLDQVRLRTGNPAGGGGWASAHDLLRFGMAHLGDEDSDSRRILSAAAFEAMTSPQAEFQGSTGRALGWFVRELEGDRFLYYTGSLPGVSTALFLHPEERVVVVVLVNGDAPARSIALQIAALAIHGRMPAGRGSEPSGGEEEGDSLKIAEGAALDRLAGVWSGAVRVDEREIPILLGFQADGTVTAQVGDAEPVPLEHATFDDGLLRGRIAAMIPVGHAELHPHSLDLMLQQVEDTLAGQVTAVAGGPRPHFAISWYAALRRQSPENASWR